MLKVRCSALGNIMTDPRSKSETLSETAKSYLRELWIEENYGRISDYSNKAIEKGLHNEEDGITMLSLFRKQIAFKNEKRYENDFIKGTPDLVEASIVTDIKCSWDIFTFMGSKLTKDYEWQLRGYMALTGIPAANLVYCLTDTPRHLIEQEINRILFKMGEVSDPDQIRDQVYKNLTYSDIPIEQKIRIFTVFHEEDKLTELYARIEKCREYYNSLSLSNVNLTGE